jgi:2-methylcitrate dehydratase PrpD
MGDPEPAGPRPSLTRALITHSLRAVDAESRRRAVLHWLDWMACVAAAARSPVAGVLKQWEMQPGAARPQAALLGMAQDRYHAVLLDAGAANVEEMDDLHREAILHPGPVVIPALASLARDRALHAGAVLDALVRGYDCAIRIGRAVGRRHYFHWHNTATAGTFGAAAACADALGLSLEERVWALGNAGTQAAGLWQVRLEPVMSKQLHTAHAAWSGLTAATLAGAGFTGPQYILEGERGFFAAMCEDADPGAIASEDEAWLIHETSFKPWAACRHTHATIDCVLALKEQYGSVADFADFAQASVETFGDAVAICHNPRPRTKVEAKFSLEYCVAATAKFAGLQPQHFDGDVLAREDLQARALRVGVAVAPDIDARYPRHYGARVRMRLSDGREVVHEERDSLGDPERALSASQVFDKARSLMAYGGVAPARAQRAFDAAQELLEEGAPMHSHLAAPYPAALLEPLFPAD